MLRVVIYVTLLAVLFGGAVLSAGNAIGAWEPIPPSPPAATTSTQVEKPHKKHNVSAKAHRHRVKKKHGG